ncbi:LuxR family transcriptional regulator [Reticulibacter mediterranei]|uniref:LuxR family transcriptional regulator n=1 Tax=Reticulibacter mediterranei TaxID=2778369 RepID=A0A8J3J237_9CHLR|nr:LuxR C-terminal-related transcriptional regulator [Reticulibacter mediterranei]GHO99366.1 LuxR family transcriptional regulator [Reticulibacter mediterranei]
MSAVLPLIFRLLIRSISLPVRQRPIPDARRGKIQENGEKNTDNNGMSEIPHLSTSTTASDLPSTNLLSTKLALPRPRHSLVPREELFSHLDSGMDHTITLLSAPAGFGKTTVVRAWIAARNANQEQFKAAWLSLDGEDNDPVRFWRYVIAACQCFDTTIGQSALEWLSSTQPFHFDYSSRISFESVVTGLLNGLNRMEAPCVLVIEDYHVIALSHIHEMFAYFLDHLPATIHVILLSRSDLPLPLAHLRAQGNMFEIRTADLRFSLEETRAFLQQRLPFPLSEEMVERVYERTEGWGAGLNLLVLALRRYTDHQELERFVATLTGRYRPLLEYLVSDVLNTQPEPLQLFLLQTSGLARLTGSLCDAVTGRTDSDLLIEQIERANLFLEPLDGAGEWYRYHSLFAEAMQHEALHRLGTEGLGACLQRASNWYEQENQLTDAVETALKARDFTRAAILIERLSGSTFEQTAKEFYTLRRWFAQIPLAVLQGFSTLYLAYISVCLFDPSGRIATDPERVGKIETLLDTAEQSWRDGENASQLGPIYALRALLISWQGDFKRAGTFAKQALTYLEEKEADWRSPCLSIIGAEERLFGSLDVALRLAQESLKLNRLTGGNPYGDRAVRLELGELFIQQGELRQAAETYQQIYAEAGADLFDRAKSLLGLAQLSYEGSRLDVALEEAEAARDFGLRLSDEEIQIRAALVLVKVQYARGDVEQAHLHIAELVARARGYPSPFLYREILYWRARLHLRSGDLAAVERWLNERSSDNDMIPLPLLIREDVLVARRLLVRGDRQEAQQFLEQCLSTASQHGYTDCVLEIRALLALAHFQQNNLSEAWRILQEVLPQARAKGYQRLFLDEGEAMMTLLSTFEGSQQKQPRALSAAVIEPLSTQEQRVLRLFVAGLSKPEIASELVISTNTVKTHLQRIYRKLNITSRAEAREVVRRLHLL